MEAEKPKKLESVEKLLVGQFGKGAIMSLGDSAPSFTDGFSTGSLALNESISGNAFVGIPKGRIIEIFGPESCGKTTLCLHFAAETIKATGLKVLYCDSEHALDSQYVRAILGKNIEKMDVSQPDTGEDGFDLIVKLLEIEAARKPSERSFCLVVVDSVVGMVPRAEIEGTMDDSNMGTHARLMARACRKIRGASKKSGISVVFINQLRMKLGVVFGNPEETPGGKALKFYADVRIRVDSPRGGKVEESVSRDLAEPTEEQRKNGEKPKKKMVETGTVVKTKTVKNKLFPPFRRSEFEITYGRGINKLKDFLDMLAFKRIIAVEGKHTVYGGKTVSSQKFEEEILQQGGSGLKDELMKKLREAVGNGKAG